MHVVQLQPVYFCESNHTFIFFIQAISCDLSFGLFHLLLNCVIYIYIYIYINDTILYIYIYFFFFFLFFFRCSCNACSLFSFMIVEFHGMFVLKREYCSFKALWNGILM